MTNTTTNNTNNNVSENIIPTSLLQDVLNKHNVKVNVNEKVFSERQKEDSREGWVKKRDTLVANLQHEINIFNIDDESKVEKYLNYWGDENSVNKDKFFYWLDEENTIKQKNTYNRRIVKDIYSMKSIEDGEKPDGKKKYKRVNDKHLGYEIDIMIGCIPLLGRILNTKKDGSTIYKKLTNKDGSPKLGKDGKQLQSPTWINNTIKNSDGSPLNKEDVIKLLPSLKESFEGDNFKDKFIEIDLSMKSDSNKKNTSKKSQSNQTEDTSSK